jgi:hypothetical protein
VARDRKNRESRRERKLRKAKEKQPLGKRIGKKIGNQARALGELGDVIVNRPRTLPNRAYGWFRQWFARVWRVRGGGLYAFGFAASFAIYELRMLIDDFGVDSDFIVLFDGQIVEFILNFILESLTNTVYALVWPVQVVQFAPPFGAIGLGLAYVFFARVLKGPIERWLFAELTESGACGESQDENADRP